MLFHAILTLTCPTDTNAKKARIAEEIITAAEAVFAKGMSIPEVKEELEEEQEMWTAQWDCRLVCGGALWINWELTGLQDLLQVSLQKARDHGMEPRVAGHITVKMEEAHPLYARWKTEAAAGHEEAMWKAEEVQWVKEEWWAALSMSFKLTGLLSSEVASGKAKGKGKAPTHVGGAARSGCQIGGPVVQTNKGETSALTSSWQAMMASSSKWQAVHLCKMNLDPVHTQPSVDCARRTNDRASDYPDVHAMSARKPRQSVTNRWGRLGGERTWRWQIQRGRPQVSD